MSKADVKFVERMVKKHYDPRHPDSSRLFDLAFRGAEAAAKIKRLQSALQFVRDECEDELWPHILERIDEALKDK